MGNIYLVEWNLWKDPLQTNHKSNTGISYIAELNREFPTEFFPGTLKYKSDVPAPTRVQNCWSVSEKPLRKKGVIRCRR